MIDTNSASFCPLDNCVTVCLEDTIRRIVRIVR